MKISTLLFKKSERIVCEKQIAEIETDIEEREQIAIKALSLCKNPQSLFDAATEKSKRALVRAYFPDGFCIERAERKVRTPRINLHFVAIVSNSANCGFLKIESGPIFAFENRTPNTIWLTIGSF